MNSITRSGLATGAICVAGLVLAQPQQNLPVDLPDGPAKPGFDIDRFSNAGNGWFETFYVDNTELLSVALKDGRLNADTLMLVLDAGETNIALVTDQMAFHHLAQGTSAGQNWLATFCVVCNSGTSLVPTIDGEVLHFENVGLYDAIFVMQDIESKTLWNHISGEALYGPHVGKTLGPVGNLLQMNVTEALEYDPEIQVAISDRPFIGRTRGPGPANSRSADSQLSGMFSETLGEEDTRRPRMDMGLGIWTSESRIYYPMEEIRARGNAFIDTLDGREVLVFINPGSSTPMALFVDGAKSAVLDGSDVQLDSGAIVRSGMYLDADGTRHERELPQQIFTRWYGYALTFPGATVYGQQ